MQAVTTTKEEILPRSKPFLGTLGNSNKIIRNDGGHPFSQFASLFFAQSLRERILSFSLKLGMKAETIRKKLELTKMLDGISFIVFTARMLSLVGSLSSLQISRETEER